MPELQKLWDRFKNDPNVTIVTIDSADTTKTLRTFLGKNKYTFPVLLEGDYLPKADIKSFPTTWFLNTDGRIVFTKVGRTINLEAEFGWRIDALRKSEK